MFGSEIGLLPRAAEASKAEIATSKRGFSRISLHFPAFPRIFRALFLL